MSQWPGTLNQNSISSRGRPQLNPSSSFEASLKFQSKSKSRSPFRTMNTVSYSESEPKYSDLARQKLEAGKYSARMNSRDQKRDTDSTSTPRMAKAIDSRKHSRRVSLTEEDNYYGNFPQQGSYLHSELSPNSSNMLSLDDRDLRSGISKMRKMRQKSQEAGGRGDSVSSNSRFEEFMQNLQQKKRQISQEIESQQEVSPVYPVMQQEDSIYKDENTLQLSNVRMEDIFKRRGSPYTMTNDKMLFFEDETGNHRDHFGDGNVEKLSAQQIFHENMALLNKKSNLGSRIEEEEEFGKRDGLHNSSFGDDLSLNPSFLKDEAPGMKTNLKAGAGFGDNPFQPKSYVNTELEVELLRSKKEVILLENRVQEKDSELEELKSALEEAQTEMIKMHDLRDRDVKRMRQMEEEFLQQKSINKTIQQELSQTLMLQPVQKQHENEGENESIQGLESYQMIRLLKQDRAFLRRKVEECDRELEIQKQRNENLRKELTQVHDKELQKSPLNNEAEQILASYAQEIETLRMMNQKADRRAEELLREMEARESRFEKDFENERKKFFQAKKEIEKLVEEKDKVDNAMREVQVQQKIRTATFKVEMDKVKELMTELSRENQHYRKEIKVLSKNQNMKEKIEYLESYYKQQLRNVLKENDALQKKVKRLEEEKKGEEEKENEKEKEIRPKSRRMTEDVELENDQQNKMKTQRKVSKADQFNSFESQKETVRMQGRTNQVDKDMAQLMIQLEEAEAKIEKLKKAEEGYVKEIERLRGVVEDLRSEKGDIEKRVVDEYKEKLKAANQEIDNLKSANTILASKETNVKVSEYRKQSEKHQEELRALRKTMKQKLDEAQEENIVNKTNNENLKRLVHDQEETARDYQDKMNKEMQSLREEVKEHKKQLEEKQKEVDVLKQKGNSRKNTREVNPNEETLAEELERHRMIVEKQKDMINKYVNENKEFKKVIQEQESHLVQVESDRDHLEKTVKQNEDEMKRFQKKIDELVMQVVQLEEKHQELVKQNKALKGK